MDLYERVEVLASEYYEGGEKKSYVYIAVMTSDGRAEMTRVERGSLENILEDIEKQIPKKSPPQNSKELARRASDYIKNDSKSIEDYVASTNEDVTVEVPYIAPNVLGTYDPVNDQVRIVQGLSPHLKEWVKAHEWAHRRRAYTGESQDERLVDAEASALVGYDPVNRWN